VFQHSFIHSLLFVCLQIHACILLYTCSPCRKSTRLANMIPNYYGDLLILDCDVEDDDVTNSVGDSKVPKGNDDDYDGNNLDNDDIDNGDDDDSGDVEGVSDDDADADTVSDGDGIVDHSQDNDHHNDIHHCGDHHDGEDDNDDVICKFVWCTQCVVYVCVCVCVVSACVCVVSACVCVLCLRVCVCVCECVRVCVCVCVCVNLLVVGLGAPRRIDPLWCS